MAIEVDFDLSGLAGFGEQIKKLMDDMPDIMLELTNREANKAVGFIKEETPTGKTGLLKNSWHAEPPKKTGEEYKSDIVNNVEYASYVEYGHRTRKRKDGKRSWVPANPMLIRGLQEYTDGMDDGMDDFLGKKMKQYLEG